MAKIKHIQINIFGGKYLGNLVNFLQDQNPDFITMQEVTGGVMSYNMGLDLFSYLKDKLSMQGVFNKDFDVENPSIGFDGNAVFSKYEIIKTNVVVLKKPTWIKKKSDINSEELSPKLPVHMLAATCDFEGSKVDIISWHGAWSAPPKDTEETLRQANLAANYIKSLKNPFILGGDLNNVVENETIKIINKVAKNLMIGSNVKQTTHPQVHKIVPRGYLIDYIFVSPDFKLETLEVPNITVSDHLPVVARLELAHE